MLIDLILADRRHYTYENYAARQIKKALEKFNLQNRTIYLSDGFLSDYFELIREEENRPNWALGFETLSPYCKPLCDIFQIRYFYWTEESIAPALNLLQSAFGNVGIHDLQLCEKLQNPKLHFLPHGVEESSKLSVERLFDLVLFADLIDLNFLKTTWAKNCSPEAIHLISEAIHFKDPFKAGEDFFFAEQYLKAEETYKKVREIGNQTRLDIFGEHMGNNWLIRLPPNVHLHSKLPYTEYFELLVSSKLALIEPSSPWYLQAIALGCLPVPADLQKINFYLLNPAEREKKLELLQRDVSKRTWDLQTEKLIGYMA